MMKYIPVFLFAIAAAVMTGCGGTNEQPEQPKKTEVEKKLPFEQRFKKEIEAKLKIPATEKYSYEIFRAYISGDSLEDAIITVNRMEFAIDEAIRKDNTAKAAEVGYLGNYNWFFYYDASIDQISEPVPVPSSPGRKLDVSFAKITSPSRDDLIVGYRIRNSGWISYFTAKGDGKLSLMFQWKWFDHAGEDTPEALKHELDLSPEGVSHDISIYESSIDHYDKNIRDIYAYVPSITKKGRLLYRFFYDPRITKYRLYSPQMLREMGLTAYGKLER